MNMYLAFYQFKHKPFQISTDPRFLWLGDKHEEALATLRYGILDNKGFLLLTGDVGTGKTTLINALLRTLQKNVLVATIRDPALSPIDFFNYTAHAFTMEGSFSSKGSFLVQFEQFLLKANSENKKVLLIIDEAQRINQELLEEVRLLSNIEKEDSKLLNIFFVGQIEFNEILLMPENRPIRQRITVNYNIPPLTRQETGEYISHRLKVAGSRLKIFEEQALNEIFTFSKGYPRLINIICDRCLLTGFVEESKTVTINHVKECAAELKIPKIEHGDFNLQDPKRNKHEIISENAASHHITNEQENTNIKSIFGISLLTMTVLILLSLVYLNFSENQFKTFLRRSITDFTQDFWQATDRLSSPKTHSKKENANQIDPQKKQLDQHPNSKKILTNKNTLEKGERPSDENSGIEMNHLEAINREPQLQSDSSQSYRKSIIHIGKLEDRTENQEPGNTNKEKTLSEVSISTPPKNTIIDQKIIPIQKNHIKFLENFEKLVIPFPTDSNYPHFESLENLNLLIDAVRSQSQYNIMVSGFSDSQGIESYNIKLSEFRAYSVKSYLTGKGLKDSQIKTQGLGSKNPIATNDTLSGRKINRRVEITIYK